MAAKSIKGAVEYLRARYSEQKAPSLKGSWEMVLWENIAYLADDDERKKAMLTLKQTVGLQPKQISAASDKALMGVTQHGILPQQFVEKLRQCAQIAVDDFGGDLDTVLDAEP